MVTVQSPQIPAAWNSSTARVTPVELAVEAALQADERLVGADREARR